MKRKEKRKYLLEEMEMLDKFACAALSGFRLASKDVRTHPDGVNEIAQDTYALAQAMMKHRDIILVKRAEEVGLEVEEI